MNLNRREMILAAIGMTITGNALNSFANLATAAPTQLKFEPQGCFLILDQPMNVVLSEQIFKTWKRTNAIHTRILRGTVLGDKFLPNAAVIWTIHNEACCIETNHLKDPISIDSWAVTSSPKGFIVLPHELKDVMATIPHKEPLPHFTLDQSPPQGQPTFTADIGDEHGPFAKCYVYKKEVL